MKTNIYTGLSELYAMEGAKNYNNWIVNLCSYYISGKMLEIGAGIGTFTEEWVQYTDSLVAIEIADNCIDELKSRFKEYGNISILKQDICSLTDDHYNRYDTVIAINVFEHIAQEA